MWVSGGLSLQTKQKILFHRIALGLSGVGTALEFRQTVVLLWVSQGVRVNDGLALEKAGAVPVELWFYFTDFH